MSTDVKEKILSWFNSGLWTADMVAEAVERKIITADDYEYIIGEEYKEKKYGENLHPQQRDCLL